MSLAPIGIFVYNRPSHTKNLFDSLQKNQEFQKSKLFVFSDGAKTDSDKYKVQHVRDYIKNLNIPDLEIVESESNNGLANSIITGVSKMCKEHGKAIVIEDDLILSPYFLDFMNRALNHYEDIEQVMHISGYSYPLDGPLPKSFFYRNASPWGWGTWEKSWCHFQKDSAYLLKEIKKAKLVEKFNINGSFDYYKMLKAQSEGKVDSWSIRWDASILLKGGLSLYPGESYVFNNGHDGSGRHCGVQEDFRVKINTKKILSFPKKIIEDSVVLEKQMKFNRGLRKSWIKLILNKIKSL